tara:strand:- start:662 stop:1192 length:531 start_codon:yes stop_codon:yes gene_type:complete
MSRNREKPQKGYSQLLEGNRLATARVTNVSIHHKHSVQIARYIKGMYAGAAVDYLERVTELKRAIPYVARHRKGRGGNTMAGHRKGAMGPGRFPVKASRQFIKLIQSAMDNARQHHEDVEPEEMLITHIAAHRGEIQEGFRPRARGRTSPKNHYQVNLEIFLEAFGEDDEESEEDF